MPISLAGFTKLNSMTENDLTGLLLQLADRGVTGIKIYYAGGGDSGAIEDVVYTTEVLDKDEDAAFEIISDLPTYGLEKAPDLKDLDSGLNSDISDFAEEAILNDIEDWWNNDGGNGTMSIMVPSGKYKINNTIYITESVDFFHEGDLLSKA
jgi:hypothetical protein